MTMLGAKRQRERLAMLQRENRWMEVPVRWYGCATIVVDGVKYPVKPGPNQGMWRMPPRPMSPSEFARRMFARGAITREALTAVVNAERKGPA